MNAGIDIYIITTAIDGRGGQLPLDCRDGEKERERERHKDEKIKKRKIERETQND